MVLQRRASTSTSPTCSPICGACCSEIGGSRMAQQIEVKVPDIGDFKDVAVIEVMVKAGETVAIDTSLIMVESDKASMEIPSSHAGVVKSIKVKEGDKVSEGSVILTLQAAEANPPSPQPSPARAGEGTPAPSPAARERAGG